MNSSPDELMSENMSMNESSAETDLLLQFQCMGTNDRDALIAEFQRLLGSETSNLRPEACAFFLEMNNWNLQQAICSYFDFDSPRELATQQIRMPAMTLIRDVTVGDGEEVTPNTRFTKTWKIMNPGVEKWPEGCTLRFSSGAQMTFSDGFVVDPLEPGQIHDLSIEMVSPHVPGIYEGQWRMTTPNGMPFGEVIWVIVSVAEGGLLGLTQQMNSFNSLGSAVNQSATASTSTPVVTVTTPEAATLTIAGSSNLHNPFGRGTARLIRQSDEVDGHAVAFPHHVHIDRVKSLSTDDNDENCIQICKEILNRSPANDASVNRPSVIAGGDQTHAIEYRPYFDASSVHMPSSSSSQYHTAGVHHNHQHDLHNHLHLQNPTAPSQPDANQTTATTFPPTPPSDDMMAGE